MSYDKKHGFTIIHIGKYKGKRIKDLSLNQLRDCIKSKIPSRLKSIINLEILYRIKNAN